MFAKVIARWLPQPLLLLAAGWTSLAAQDLRFQHITTDDGLSDNAITCVFEDCAGFIWIGTEHGLNRYDGQRVERFMAGTDGPSGDRISAIAEDVQGNLWVTTPDAGLSKRDNRTGAFAHWRQDPKDPKSLPSDQLNHVLVIDDSLLVLSSRAWGAIWFNTKAGTFRPRGFQPVKVDAEGDTTVRSEQAWCHTALRLDEHRVWLPMIPAAAFYTVNAHTGDLRDSCRMMVGPLTNGLLLNGALFAAGWTPGIYRIPSAGKGPPTLLPVNDEVSAMVPWGPDLFLAATKLNGLVVMHVRDGEQRRWRHLRNVHGSLANDRVRCLLKDRSGNLWAGTADGLSVFAPNVWPFSATRLLGDGEPGDPVFHRIQQDDNGTIRIATSRGFFLATPDGANVRQVPLRSKGIELEPTGLFPTIPGEWFIGTETGFFRYDPAHERLVSADETRAFLSYGEKTMYQIRSIYLDTVDIGPRLIVGGLGYGHHAFDPFSGEYGTDWKPYPAKPKVPMMQRSTLKDRHGTYWTATSDGLVNWMPARSGVPWTTVIYRMEGDSGKTLPGVDVTAIALRSDTIWAALRDAGLVRIVEGVVQAFRPPSHIPHDALGLAVDASGRIWYTTSDGLVRFDPASKEWLHVPVNDGHDFRRLNSCILTLGDGRIAFCADRHLITFHPRVFDVLPELPAPALVEVKNTWGQIPISDDAEVEIPYRSSSFDAVISALQPTATGPLEFVYRLEGVDADARSANAREAIRYAGVPTGAHRLLVRVRDGYGREGPERTLLTVTVIGPFWQRWWFFLIVLGAGALGMYLVSRLRQKQRMRLQRVRDRIARDLHDDIGSTLGSISFYSEALKRSLSDTNDAIAQQVAEKIGSSSRDMIDQMSDIVWSVDPKNDDAGALVTRLQAFASDLLAAKNIPLHFHADATLNERKLSAEQRRNIFLICKEVLHNAVKYADARSVTITVESTGRALELSIADDGKGFDPANTDSYNGNGLPNMRVRAEAIGGTFTIDSSPGNGTRARISVPQHLLTPRSGD